MLWIVIFDHTSDLIHQHANKGIQRETCFLSCALYSSRNNQFLVCCMLLFVIINCWIKQYRTDSFLFSLEMNKSILPGWLYLEISLEYKSTRITLIISLPAVSFSYSSADSQGVLMNVNRIGNKKQGGTFKCNSITEITPNEMRYFYLNNLMYCWFSLISWHLNLRNFHFAWKCWFSGVLLVKWSGHWFNWWELWIRCQKRWYLR